MPLLASVSSWPPSPAPREEGPSTPWSRHRQHSSASGSHFSRLPIPKDSRSPFSGVETGMVGPERLEEESGFCLCWETSTGAGKIFKVSWGWGVDEPWGTVDTLWWPQRRAPVRTAFTAL